MGVGTREGSFFTRHETRQCRKIAKNNKNKIANSGTSRANSGIKPTSIDREDPISLKNLQSESILLSSLQSYLDFNFFPTEKVMENGCFLLKNDFF